MFRAIPLLALAIAAPQFDPPHRENRPCDSANEGSSFGEKAAWAGLGALFGGLVGYTSVSRGNQSRPQLYVGAGLLVGGGLGLAASRPSECSMTDGR